MRLKKHFVIQWYDPITRKGIEGVSLEELQEFINPEPKTKPKTKPKTTDKANPK